MKRLLSVMLCIALIITVAPLGDGSVVLKH